ncbi:MAG TPA: Lrp/AsnC family transcriptional regulator [Bacteroidia bacterium]|jgi:DNA-binding Lrp family transcriptional regulator|nr:Lrp/AsnC family transcriptional regulator [Bacteroidia bacterium]
MKTLDTIDKKILRLLQKDARLNTKEIADKIGLSVTPTYERLKKIEKTKVIKGYVALLDPQIIGKTCTAFCTVTLRLHSAPLLKQFEQALRSFPEVMECYHVAGAYDYLIKIVVDNMNDYKQLLVNKLAAMENIANVQSSFIMTEIKHETAYVLG